MLSAAHTLLSGIITVKYSNKLKKHIYQKKISFLNLAVHIDIDLQVKK